MAAETEQREAVRRMTDKTRSLHLNWLVLAAVITVLALLAVFVHALLVLVLAMTCLTLIHLGAMTLSAVLLRARLKEIAIFYMPYVCDFGIGETRVRVGALPLGGFIDFLSAEDMPAPVERDAALAVPRPRLLREDLRPWQLTIVSLSGPLALFVSAALVLGFTAAATSWLLGFPQILIGALNPSTVGKDLLTGFFRLIQGQLLVAGALLSTKVAAFNCLPLGTTNGGQVLLQLVRWGSGRNLPAGPVLWFGIMGYLACGALCMMWVVALVFALYEGAPN